MRRHIAILLAAMVTIASCGVPTDESAQPISPEQLPESLRPDFTTTSTTSVPAPVTETAVVYLLWSPPDSERTVVVGVTREVPFGASAGSILETLFGAGAVTDEDADAGYFNSLFELALLGVTVSGSVATIDMVPLTPEGEPSDEPFTGDLIGAAAQLVYSGTELPEIDAVRILIAGEAVSIPTNDGDADPGAELTQTNYERFNPDTPDSPTTTTVPAAADDVQPPDETSPPVSTADEAAG